MLLPSQIVNGFIRGAAAVLRSPGLAVAAAVVVVIALRYWWKRRESGARARAVPNWPTVSATIEVPAVVQQVTPETSHQFVASLTYFYRNPELQMGEYRRSFATKEHAKQWAAQFKGRTVPVHVNPLDATESVLLQQDVAGTDFGFHAPLSPEAAMLSEMPQVISPPYRLICGLAELAGLAGLATSAVLLCVCIAMRGRLRPEGFYWAAGVLLGLCVAAAIAVQIHLMRSEQGRWLLRSYKRWCPGWMRWSLRATGGSATLPLFSHLLNFVHLLNPQSFRFLHEPWARALAPYVPYVIACWLFFMATAFHAALLRSQEELRVSVVEA